MRFWLDPRELAGGRKKERRVEGKGKYLSCGVSAVGRDGY